MVDGVHIAGVHSPGWVLTWGNCTETSEMILYFS